MNSKTSSFAALAALAVAAIPLAPAGGAPRPPAASASRCVGSYTLKIFEEPSEPPLEALVQLNADGTLTYGETSAITSLTPAVPVEYTSPGFGLWKPRANGCRYRILVKAADVNGTPTRTSDIRGTITFGASGNRFAGPLRIRVNRTDSTKSAFTTRAEGVRIRLIA